MLYAYIILLVYSLFRGVRGCLRIICSYRYLTNNDSKGNQIAQSGFRAGFSGKFYILIPVLREQEIIEQTIRHFANLDGNYHVFLITTEKEQFDKKFNKNIPEKYRTMPTTKEMVVSYLKKHRFEARKVSLIHSPNTKGVVAHQYNYALEKMIGIAHDNDFVIVYNADSRVNKNILSKYAEIIDSEKDCNAIQQSAVFLANYNDLSLFLKSISLLQTRWTLAHEVPRILNTYGKLGFLEGAHVVAHGLCLRYGFFRKIGWFPENFLNEDLPLGYFIRLHGSRIFLLKNLENADTPTSVRSMFNQYRTWFYGLLYYPEYMKAALRNKEFKKMEILIWGVKYFVRGLLWLGLSFAWIAIFVLPFLLGNLSLLWLSVCSFIIYAPVSFLLVFITVGKDFGIKIEPGPLLMSIPAYLTHSLGPIMATYDMLKSYFFGIGVYKNKTER